MTRRLPRLVLAALALWAAPRLSTPASAERLPTTSFGPVVLYAPSGPPKAVVLFVSGDGGWNLGVVPMAERLRDLGALVAGIDIRPFVRSLEASRDCAYPAGALEELSRSIQLHLRLPVYQRPILVGYSSGATLVYAALAAAPAETFRGAISLGFCPDIEMQRPLCRARGLDAARRPKGVGYDLAPFPRLGVPWLVLQGEVDQVCNPARTREFVAATGSARLISLPKVGHGFAVTRRWERQFVEAFERIASEPERDRVTRESAALVADLPLVEVPAAADGELLAVMLSGDGGWADIDKGVAAGLAAAGVPVVGWSSLRYYWTPRTPEAAAQDLSRIAEHYLSAWRRRRLLLVGYSFGADVLPFLVNRLPASLQNQIAAVALLGFSDTASFDFHVTQWLDLRPEGDRPTLPEARRLQPPLVCVRGSEERESACSLLSGPRVRVLTVSGRHHLGGDYASLARLVLESVPEAAPRTGRP